MTTHTNACQKPTGWDNGLSQDYDAKLGRWFADRPGARQQLKETFMTTHTNAEALRLADELEARWSENLACSELEAAALIRQQAQNIEQLRVVMAALLANPTSELMKNIARTALKETK